MRCPNCLTLNPPNAKFCLECGNRLVICPNCGTVNLPVAKFCIECGTSLQAAKGEITSPLPPVTNVESVTPPEQFAGNGNKSTLMLPEERRVVTIMFADITGSTPLADRLDPEDMRAILVGYFNLMAQQIRRHGGTVEKYIGDAVMAVFGAPVAHEDDPDRAIRAALDMQAALADFNSRRQAQDPEATRLQMRIGINTGEVAAPGAQSLRQDFLITGDAVNVAARLQQVAAPDTILAGERTYLATREVFAFRPIAPLHLRGKPEPISAWIVEGFLELHPAITQHPRGIKGLETRFIGRALELTLIHATYARVQAERQPHLITLLGVPGVGKSRLIREFIAREQEAAKSTSSYSKPVVPKVLQGRCPPYGEGLTYWPLVEILRSLLHAQDGESTDDLQSRFTAYVRDVLAQVKRSEEAEQVASAIIRSIGSWLSDTSNEQTFLERRELQRSTFSKSKSSEQSGLQATLLRAWRVFLEAVAQQQPLILIIDDLQWADEALLDLLEYLTERMTDVPILFLCPARPDFFERRRDWGGGRRNFTTIELEALSSEETSELVNALLSSTDLPEVLRNTILSRAEGNPFFVEEIVRMLIDQGVLVNDNGCWHVSEQNAAGISELASPAAPPGDTLIDAHYVLPMPRVPDTIQGVLAARVDLLSQVEKQVLQHASIIGRTFWLAGLLELASNLDQETVLFTLNSLIAREFIAETEKQGRSPIENDRVFSFKHVLIRDVVYNNIPRMRRSQEHARLALWIEAHTVNNEQLDPVNRYESVELFAELLAYHYQQALATWSASLLPNPGAADGNEIGTPVQLTRAELRHRSIMYLRLAGDQALHSYYTIRAIQAYSEAVDLLTESDADALTLARMHQKLGDAYAQRLNGDEAWQEYCRALQLLTRKKPDSAGISDKPDEALGRAPARGAPTMADAPEVSRVSTPDIPTLADMPEVRRVSTPDIPTLADMPEVSRVSTPDIPTMADAPEVSRAPARGAPTMADTPTLLNLYDRLAELATRWLGTFSTFPDVQEVRSYIDAGLQLLEGKPDSRERAAFLTYQALWYMRQVDMKIAATEQRAELAEQALSSGNEALRISQELNDSYALWIALDALGFIYHERRMYLESHSVQHHRLQLASLISSREETHDLYISLGYVHERICDYSSAAKWFGRAWRIAQTMESPSMLLTSMEGRMHVWYQWNRWDEVRDVAGNIIQVVEQYSQDERWQLEALEVLADLAYRTGEQEEADSYVRQYRRLLDSGSSPAELPVSIYLAREDWAHAAEICKKMLAQSEPFPRPAILANLAELLVITGESAETQQTTCDRAIKASEQAGARKSLAIALRARGRMHLEQQNWAAAESDLQTALDLSTALDTPFEQGLILYCLGLLYHRRASLLNANDANARSADLGRAQHHLEQALGYFESLKAARNVERACLLLAQSNKAPV